MVLKFFTNLFFLLNFCVFYAQDGSVKGVVTDNNNVPLADVYVYNSNSDVHSHTLENGNFTLSHTQVGDVLTFKLLGFESYELQLTDSNYSTTLNIKLKAEAFQLSELELKQFTNPTEIIEKFDAEVNPVNSSQEVLRKVPGLFIGQHAGGGKAEQIFLRGFDVDHGTDVAISVDGMPVNMVSHAHGQGYADLHFVIPETIDNVNFGKGPHYAEQGNFNTAGYVAFTTKEKYDDNELKLEIGDFNTFRTVGLFNLLDNASKDNASLAFEYLEGDGPFDSPQNLNRINFNTKYAKLLKDNSKLTFAVSHFTSRWDASGQIPERAVESGLISRFGAIDDTEGGNTSRTNFNITHNKTISEKSNLKTNVYYSHYDFELFSNFTFFLNDPDNGDQIRQFEDRNIFGFNTVLNTTAKIADKDVKFDIGAGLRNDQVNDNELSHTLNRDTVLEYSSLGNVNETNAYSFVNATLNFGDFKISPSLRLDYFNFMYEDDLEETYETQTETKVMLNPKLNMSYDFSNNFNLFLKTSTGFHSNDTRVVVENGGEDILPRAYGADFGFNWKPISNLFLNTTTWYLGLDQEFVYVGDEGVVEPSGETRRLGVDFSARYQLNNWLFLDSDFTYTHARSIEEEEGEDYIPLAPEFTATGGLTVDNLKNFSGSIKCRFLGDRAANEDYSVTAEGYTVFDANVNYTYKNLTFGVIVENLFDTEWYETQFLTESRLIDEAESVEEIHFTPGTPFFLKGMVSVKF